MHWRLWLLPAICLVLVACSRAATISVPLPDKAVRTDSACPPESSKGGACYKLSGVEYYDAVRWFQAQMTAAGWAGLTEIPNDEPITLVFTKEKHQVSITLFRGADGLGMLIHRTAG